MSQDKRYEANDFNVKAAKNEQADRLCGLLVVFFLLDSYQPPSKFNSYSASGDCNVCILAKPKANLPLSVAKQGDLWGRWHFSAHLITEGVYHQP